jgi:hypothetical protein
MIRDERPFAPMCRDTPVATRYRLYEPLLYAYPLPRFVEVNHPPG